MNQSEKAEFGKLLAGVMAFYRQDLSEFASDVWFATCSGFDMDQVRKAFTAHATDPERGQFPPKPADIVRALQGTKTDRSLIAWGKVLGAMQRVGAYTTVCFDDPAIHAAIVDLGGWVQICRSSMDELPHLERRFCQSHKAYASRGTFEYPPRLAGAHDMENGLRGFKPVKTIFIGDETKAKAVMHSGSTPVLGPVPIGISLNGYIKEKE